MKKKIPKYQQIPKKIYLMKNEADMLLEEGHHQAAILYYALFTEQLIITAYLYINREKNLDESINSRNEIFSKKENGNFTFGRVIELTVPVIADKIDSLNGIQFSNGTQFSESVRMINKIRNNISAHPHFAMMLFPSNWAKRGMSDGNYYRKVLRSLRNFMREDLKISYPSDLDDLINNGHPLTIASSLDERFTGIEDKIKESLAKFCKKTTEEIREDLRFILK